MADPRGKAVDFGSAAVAVIEFLAVSGFISRPLMRLPYQARVSSGSTAGELQLS